MRLLITTCEESQAEDIADHLLREKLVACVNTIGPVKSKYRWEGKIETASEYLLLMKTRDELAPLAKRRIKEIHSYEVPEIISLEAEDVDSEYLAWVERVTERKGAAKEG